MDEGTRELTTARHWRDLASVEDLPTDGGGLTIEVQGRRYAVFLHEDRIHVLDDACPHVGASLGEGVISRGEITCPWHGWHFDLCTGRNADGLDACAVVHPSRISGGRVEAQLPRD